MSRLDGGYFKWIGIGYFVILAITASALFYQKDANVGTMQDMKFSAEAPKPTLDFSSCFIGHDGHRYCRIVEVEEVLDEI